MYLYHFLQCKLQCVINYYNVLALWLPCKCALLCMYIALHVYSACHYKHVVNSCINYTVSRTCNHLQPSLMSVQVLSTMAALKKHPVIFSLHPLDNVRNGLKDNGADLLDRHFSQKHQMSKVIKSSRILHVSV